MNGLTDLSVLLTAPALKEIKLRLGHLAAEQITQLAAHSALKRANIGLGTSREPATAKAGLPLPPLEGPSLCPAPQQEQRITE